MPSTERERLSRGGFSIDNHKSTINNQSDPGFLALQKRIFKERGLDLSQYKEKCTGGKNFSWCTVSDSTL